MALWAASEDSLRREAVGRERARVGRSRVFAAARSMREAAEARARAMREAAEARMRAATTRDPSVSELMSPPPRTAGLGFRRSLEMIGVSTTERSAPVTSAPVVDDAQGAALEPHLNSCDSLTHSPPLPPCSRLTRTPQPAAPAARLHVHAAKPARRGDTVQAEPGRPAELQPRRAAVQQVPPRCLFGASHERRIAAALPSRAAPQIPRRDPFRIAHRSARHASVCGPRLHHATSGARRRSASRATVWRDLRCSCAPAVRRHDHQPLGRRPADPPTL